LNEINNHPLQRIHDKKEYTRNQGYIEERRGSPSYPMLIAKPQKE